MFLVILALLLTAVVVDVAVESAFADGASFVAGGQDLATGLDPAIVTLGIAAAAALAAVLLVAAIAKVRRRNRSETITARREEVSQAEAALEARRQMIESRLDELQLNHDELLVKRDELLSEVERLRIRNDELADAVRERHREIGAARRELADITVTSATEPSANGSADDVTVVPDVAEHATEPPRH